MKMSRQIICSFMFVFFLVTVTGISSAENNNMSFVSHLGGCIYSVAVSGNYAYVGEGQDLVVVDVSDASNPKKVGKITTSVLANDVAVSGNYAYLAYENGLLIIDVTDPTAPKIKGSYASAYGANGIKVYGKYVYVASNYGLYIVDVSDPSVPLFVGNMYTSGIGASDVAVSRDYAYVAYGTGLYVVDISDPTKPTYAGVYGSAGGANSVAASGSYVYVVNGQRHLEILNITVPTSPTLAGKYDASDCYMGDIAVSGEYAYLACADSRYPGLAILDVKDPSLPVLVEKCDISYTSRIALLGNRAYVVTSKDGVVIVDVADASSPKYLGKYNTLIEARKVLVSGNYAYIADAYNGLTIADVTDPINPKFISKYLSDGITYCLAKSGNYTYLASGNDTFVVLDVTDPSKPRLASSCNTGYGGYSTDIALSGNYAYITYVYGFAIVDVTDPSKPKLVGKYNLGEVANGVVVSGGYAYIALRDSGLIILDVSDPSSPKFVGSYATGGGVTFDVAVSGNYAYVANIVNGWDGVLVVDVTNKASPTLAGKLNNIFVAHVDVFGKYAYLASYSDGVFIVDITNTSSPTIVGHYDTTGTTVGSFLKDNNVYVADGSNGLVILKTDIQNQAPITVGQNATTTEITQKFIDTCNRNGGLSVIGNPTTEVHSAFGFEVQDFPELPATAGGVIMYNPNNKTAYFIHGAVWDKYYAYPDENKSKLGAVADDENEAAVAPQGTTGRYTKFETGTIHWISNKDNENQGQPLRGESFVTYGDLDTKYAEMKGTYGALGFPIMDQQMDSNDHGYCEFEGGKIQWDSTKGVYSSTTTQNQPLSLTLKSPLSNQKFTVNDFVNFIGVINGGTPPYNVKLLINDVNIGDIEPLDKISEEEYTLSRRMPAGEYKIRLEAIDSEGNTIKTDETTITVSLISANTVFFPSLNGYKFNNFNGEEYLWSDFRSIYGRDDTAILGVPEEEATKASAFYKDWFKDTGLNGSCFGMSASSLQLYDHQLYAYGPDRNDAVLETWKEIGPFVYGYSPNTVQDWIEYYQPLQNDKACRDDANKYGDLKTIYNELKLRMSSGSTKGLMVLGYTFDSYNASTDSLEKHGHAVVPYSIVEDKNSARIYIYDCNHPYNDDNTKDSERFIEIDLNSWNASDYGECTNMREFSAVSLEALVTTPEIPDDLVYNDNPFDAHLLFTDSSGKHLGYYMGEFKDEISGVSPIITYGQTNSGKYLESYYVPDASLKRDLYGINNGISTVSMYTPNGLITADVSVTPNSVDEFKVLNDGKGIEFNSVSGTSSLSLMIDVETSDSAQIVRANISQIETGGSIDLSNSEGTIRIENDGQPVTCSLNLEQLGINTNSNDSIENIVIEGYSTIIVKPADWNDIANSEIVIEHDIGSDGSIESTETIRQKDTTPPSAVMNLQSTNGTNWINWTWINPTDTNFDHSEIYLDGIFQTNTSAEYFNATGLQPETSYTLGTRTVDNNGNVNQTWVNSTATTDKKAIPTITWSNPADIIYGTALSNSQLNASASVNGTFVYTPLLGTVLSAGTQKLHVDFTPDDAGNYTTVSNDVTINVLTPVQGIQQIITKVKSLNLDKGQANSLIVKLDAATKNLNAGNTIAATNELNAFINKVKADIKTGKLTSTQGQALIDATNAVITALNTKIK